MSIPAPTDSDTDKTLVELPDRETAFTARKAAFHSETSEIDKFRSKWLSIKTSVGYEGYRRRLASSGADRAFSTVMQEDLKEMDSLSEPVVAALARLKSEGVAATDEECEKQIEDMIEELIKKGLEEKETQVCRWLDDGSELLWSDRAIGGKYFDSIYALNSELDRFLWDVNVKTVHDEDYDEVMNNHSTRARILAERFVKTSHEFMTKLKEKDPLYGYMS